MKSFQEMLDLRIKELEHLAKKQGEPSVVSAFKKAEILVRLQEACLCRYMFAKSEERKES